MQIRIWTTVFLITTLRYFASSEQFSKEIVSYPNKTDTTQALFQPSSFEIIESKQKEKKSVKPQITSKVLKGVPKKEMEMTHEVTVKYPTRTTGHVQSFRVPREDVSRTYNYRKTKGKKVQPGQFASKTSPKRGNNWKLWPEYVKNAMIPSDSKIAWSYWEADESEEPDDADDSMMLMMPPTTKATTTTAATTTTTTTTTTTAAPPPMTTKGPKAPVTIYKHFHYFKKAAPWKGDAGMPMTMPMPMPTPMPMPMPMSMEEVMKMTEDMMDDMMMKNMMMKSMMMPPPEMEKKGISGFWDKLSKVEPITVLVAGVIPASLILAAALPSVMTKMMWMKGEMNNNGGSPTMSTITTTAVGPPGMDMTGTRYRSSDSISSFIEAASDFGFKALEKPQCARQLFCRLAKNTIMTDSPTLQRAIQVATIAMENSWLDHLGVQDIFRSLTEGTCNDDDCESTPRNMDS